MKKAKTILLLLGVVVLLFLFIQAVLVKGKCNWGEYQKEGALGYQICCPKGALCD